MKKQNPKAGNHTTAGKRNLVSKQYKGVRWLNMGIFFGGVLFSHGLTYDETVADLNKLKVNDWKYALECDNDSAKNGNWTALRRYVQPPGCPHKKDFYFILIKEQFDFSDEHYAKLAHEVLHICQFYLPDVLNRDREYECEAYLHTHLMLQCMKAIRGIK